MKRFPIGPAEKLRASLDLDPEQFSTAIGFHHNSYAKAIVRGNLTYRMAREISMRYHIPLSELADGKP